MYPRTRRNLENGGCKTNFVGEICIAGFYLLFQWAVKFVGSIKENSHIIPIKKVNDSLNVSDLGGRLSLLIEMWKNSAKH